MTCIEVEGFLRLETRWCKGLVIQGRQSGFAEALGRFADGILSEGGYRFMVGFGLRGQF